MRAKVRFKKSLSLSQSPIYRAFQPLFPLLTFHKRFTPNLWKRCEMSAAPLARKKRPRTSIYRDFLHQLWKWKRFFENTHARYTCARTFCSCRRWVLQLIQFCILLIQQRDSCSHQKVVPLSEKLYDFFSATPVSRARIAIIILKKYLYVIDQENRPAIFLCSKIWSFQRLVLSLHSSTADVS